MKLCVIIAAYNEGPNLGPVIEGVRGFLREGDEILVVDDGSTDNTSQVARDHGARVVRQEPNQGKGMAIRRGIQEAAGDAILFIDGDGQDPPDDIPKLIEEMEKGAEMVNGSKFIGTLREGAISWPNYLGNRFMSGMINLLFGVRITDSQSGFRAFDLEKVRRLNLDSSEYEIETEMLIKAIRAGFKIVEVGVTRDKRGAGETSFKRVRNGLRILGTILRLRFSAA